MKNFKLLRGEEDEELPIDDNTASWVWDSEYVDLRQFRYEIVTSQHRGILDFLSQFPDHYIVIVHSITGNGIRHSHDSEREGWGFNIREELLTIQWYRIYV